MWHFGQTGIGTHLKMGKCWRLCTKRFPQGIGRFLNDGSVIEAWKVTIHGRLNKRAQHWQNPSCKKLNRLKNNDTLGFKIWQANCWGGCSISDFCYLNTNISQSDFMISSFWYLQFCMILSNVKERLTHLALS